MSETEQQNALGHLTELKGWEQRLGAHRVQRAQGVQKGGTKGRKWHQVRATQSTHNGDMLQRPRPRQRQVSRGPRQPI